MVGFIGLGNMGAHMAKNLLKKGYPVVANDVSPTTLQNLVEAGNIPFTVHVTNEQNFFKLVCCTILRNWH